MSRAVQAGIARHCGSAGSSDNSLVRNAITHESIPRIEAVKPIGGTRLPVRFRNGEEKIYDCGPLLSRPQFHLLTDPAFFRAVRVDACGYGISWTEEIDLSECELWTNGEPIAIDLIQAEVPA